MSKTTGIYFCKQYNKWHSRFYKNGRYFHVGRFDKLEDAIKARDRYIALTLDNNRGNVLKLQR